MATDKDDKVLLLVFLLLLFIIITDYYHLHLKKTLLIRVELNIALVLYREC